jgi:hypothetical protein
MMAGNEIDLLPGVSFNAGSDVAVRIENCAYADYTLRKAAVQQLSQKQIDDIMNDLNRGLYNAPTHQKEKISHLLVYPNPIDNIINISYNCYSQKGGNFTLHDVLGRTVTTKTYSPQTEGVQNFSIDTDELNAGTYFYTLQVGAETYQGKILKINK